MSLEVLNGGKFISRGKGQHASRIIDSDELIVVLSGELAMFQEKKEYLLEPDSWLLLRHGIRHGGLVPYPKNLTFFWIHFRHADSLLAGIPDTGFLTHRSALPEYAQLFLAEQNRTHSDEETKKLLFRLILRELRRSVEQYPEQVSQYTPLAKAADQYIRLHYLDRAAPGNIADALHCNSDYLGRIYHHTYGKTIAETVNRLRIEYAANRLSLPDRSIKEIAAESGFDDPAYFRRKFREGYNLSPGEFRKRRLMIHCNTE